MNTALVCRPSRRWLVWAAFACAAGIHIGAIVVAQGKSDKSAVQDFKPAGADPEVRRLKPTSMRSAGIELAFTEAI